MKKKTHSPLWFTLKLNSVWIFHLAENRSNTSFDMSIRRIVYSGLNSSVFHWMPSGARIKYLNSDKKQSIVSRKQKQMKNLCEWDVSNLLWCAFSRCDLFVSAVQPLFTIAICLVHVKIRAFCAHSSFCAHEKSLCVQSMTVLMLSCSFCRVNIQIKFQKRLHQATT